MNRRSFSLGSTAAAVSAIASGGRHADADRCGKIGSVIDLNAGWIFGLKGALGGESILLPTAISSTSTSTAAPSALFIPTTQAAPTSSTHSPSLLSRGMRPHPLLSGSTASSRAKSSYPAPWQAHAKDIVCGSKPTTRSSWPTVLTPRASFGCRRQLRQKPSVRPGPAIGSTRRSQPLSSVIPASISARPEPSARSGSEVFRGMQGWPGPPSVMQTTRREACR